MDDYSKLLDVNNEVLQQQISDQRKRNEAIRQRMGNYYGQTETSAGYPGWTQASNQNMDPNLLGIFSNNLAKDDLGTWYYSGDKDYSKAQIGTQGYTLNPSTTGMGMYDITKDGKSIGQSYGSVSDAITAYKNKIIESGVTPEMQQQYIPSIYDDPYGTTVDTQMYKIANPNYGHQIAGPEGDTYSDAPLYSYYKTPEEAKAALREAYGDYIPATSGGTMMDWERLGWLLNNENFGTYGLGGLYSGSINPFTGKATTTDIGKWASNNQLENITGQNALYGSLPVIYDNQVMGYLKDLGEAQENLQGYKNPFQMSNADTEGSHRYNYSLWRDLGNIDAWKKAGTFTGQGENYYVPTENVNKVPGWTQGDSSVDVKKANTMPAKAVGALGAIMSFTPLAPLGMALTAASTLMQKNPVGMLTSILGGSGALGAAGQGLSEASGLSSAASQGLVSAGVGGLSSMAQGGDFLKGALTSGLGSYGTGQLNNLFQTGLGDLGLSEYVSPETSKSFIGAGVKTGLNQMFNKSSQGIMNSYLSNLMSALSNQQKPKEQNATTKTTG